MYYIQKYISPIVSDIHKHVHECAHACTHTHIYTHTHLCLNHLYAFSSHICQKVADIYCLFFLHSLHCNMLSRTINISVRPMPALQCKSMGGIDSLNFDLTRRINPMSTCHKLRHSVIRPTKKVVVGDGDGGGPGVCRLWGTSQGMGARRPG